MHRKEKKKRVSADRETYKPYVVHKVHIKDNQTLCFETHGEKSFENLQRTLKHFKRDTEMADMESGDIHFIPCQPK